MSNSSTTTENDLIEPIHPGEILMEDFTEGFGITQNKLAVSIGMPPAPDHRDRAWKAGHHGRHFDPARAVLRYGARQTWRDAAKARGAELVQFPVRCCRCAWHRELDQR